MTFDSTITISVIIGLVATLPQIIVTWINSKHDSSIKQMEHYDIEKRDVLQNFIDKSVECFQSDNDWRRNKEFIKALYTLQLYFESADDNLIDSINKAMNDNKDFDKFKITFAVVITKLTNEIKK